MVRHRCLFKWACGLCSHFGVFFSHFRKVKNRKFNPDWCFLLQCQMHQSFCLSYFNHWDHFAAEKWWFCENWLNLICNFSRTHFCCSEMTLMGFSILPQVDAGLFCSERVPWEPQEGGFSGNFKEQQLWPQNKNPDLAPEVSISILILY